MEAGREGGLEEEYAGPTSTATAPEELLADIFSHIEAQKTRVVEVFFAVDSDGSGEMDRWEFEEALTMMKINLTSDQVTTAFSALDEDNGGTIEIEEFMTRMRREKKWRLRKLMQRTSKDNSEDIRIEALDGVEKAHAIEEAGKAAWGKAVMRAAISVWQEKGGGEMGAEEAAWRKEELEAQLAEMEAEKEEEEARIAEEMYNKEELEALAAEAQLKKEEEEANQALEDAEREEAEALEAIADAEREEEEALVAEQNAQIEVSEAEIARLDAEREAAEARDAAVRAEKEWQEARQAQAELKDAETDLEVAKATKDAEAISAAEDRVLAAQVIVDRELAEAEQAKAVADKEQEEAVAAMQNAEKEKAEALEAIRQAKKERQEANDSKVRARNEQAEAQEARAIAEKELAEMHQAKADAERERAEAEAAKANAMEERAQADRARAIAIKERAEANAAKEAWRQKKAMEQALKWKSRTKLPARKEPKKQKKPKDMPPPRSVVEDMLGRVSSSLTTFESEYKLERSKPAQLSGNSIERAQRLQALREEYFSALSRQMPQAPLPRETGWQPVRPTESRKLVATYGLSPRGRRTKLGAKTKTTSIQDARDAARATVIHPAVFREAALLTAYERSENMRLPNLNLR